MNTITHPFQEGTVQCLCKTSEVPLQFTFAQTELIQHVTWSFSPKKVCLFGFQNLEFMKSTTQQHCQSLQLITYTQHRPPSHTRKHSSSPLNSATSWKGKVWRFYRLLWIDLKAAAAIRACQAQAARAGCPAPGERALRAGCVTQG